MRAKFENIPITIILFIVISLASLLSACENINGSFLETSTSTQNPTITRTPSSTPTPTNTFTPTVTATRTLRPTFTYTPTDQVSFLPIEETPSPTPPPLSTYNTVMRLDHMIPGVIKDFFTYGENELIIAGDYGATWLKLDTNRVQTERFPSIPLGLDSTGYFWMFSDDGAIINRWDGEYLESFDRSNGWTTNVVIDQVTSSFDTFLVGPGNSVWISTSRDIRHFDGDRWRTYYPIETHLTIIRIAGVKNSIPISVTESGETLWAGSCSWIENFPMAGSGPVQFEGNKWTSVDFPASGGCILHLEGTSDGMIWVSTPDALWRGDLNAGEWEKFALPERNDVSSLVQLIENLTISPEGIPWLLVSSRQADKPYDTILYRLIHGEFMPVRKYTSLASQRLFFSDEATYSFENGYLYELKNDSWRLVISDKIDLVTVDSLGQLWVMTGVKHSPVLWKIL